MLSETAAIAHKSFNCFLVGIEISKGGKAFLPVKLVIVPRFTAILTMYIKHCYLQGYASPKGGGEFS
tara:strand:- start:102 stop:302 length:201 start_codon:yes stop_codon:yes gene_type:complete